MRLLSIKPHGCAPNNEAKIGILKEAMKRLQIDITLMNEVNAK